MFSSIARNVRGAQKLDRGSSRAHVSPEVAALIRSAGVRTGGSQSERKAEPMGFLKPAPWPFDLAEFRSRPTMQRVRQLVDVWANDGFRVPHAVPLVYVFKFAVLYAGLGLTLIGATSDLGAPWTVDEWWREPIVWQKAVVWLVFLEVIGLGGAWGPLWAQFRYLPEALMNWTRPGTFRAAPWPKLPLTGGNKRTWFEVIGYLGLLASLLAVMFTDGRQTADLARVEPGVSAGLLPVGVLLVPAILLVVLGLRDRNIFLAARGEQYWPALLIFIMFHNNFVDMVIAAKLLIVIVWVGAAVSKIGIHFTHVIPVMMSNTPWMVSNRLKRKFYRDYPNDMLPAKRATFLAHVTGTVLEAVFPIMLLFTTDKAHAVVGIVAMLALHLFILSTVPMAVPLEWNVLFGFLAVWLFGVHGSWDGYALYDISEPWIAVALAAALLFFPVLGNFRPDLVSFLPSMRQYAGNWATAMYAFAPGAELQLDRSFTKSAPTQLVQLSKLYDELEARVILDHTIAMRAMHSQGRGLLSLMQIHLGEDFDQYDLREGELHANSLIGWTFGCGHSYDERLMTAIQEQAKFQPGECLVVLVESQPIHRFRQDYRVLDAALGCLERGWFDPRDAAKEQPWLPNGPIPMHVEWRAEGVPFRQPWSARRRTEDLMTEAELA